MTAETATDQELLARTREQSSALGVFYDRYESAVVAFFVRRTVTRTSRWN